MVDQSVLFYLKENIILFSSRFGGHIVTIVSFPIGILSCVLMIVGQSYVVLCVARVVQVDNDYEIE
jgi:hypothetical protein